MVYEFPPSRLPTRKPRLQHIRRPFNLTDTCVLCFMPERNTKWYDQTGRGNNGTLSGAVFTDEGRHGQAVYFDGVNDYVAITYAAPLFIKTEFSIEMWTFPLVIGGGGVASDVLRSTPNPTAYVQLYINPDLAGGLSFKGKNNAGVVTEMACNLFTPASVWHHVVLTYDNSNARLYVDGVLGLTRALTGPLDVRGTLLLANSTNDFNGYMDEIRIYNKKLNATDILNLYQMGRP